MRKTVTVEIFIALSLTTLGILGSFLLSGDLLIWLLPFYTAITLMAYLVKWQFLITASFLMPLITAIIQFDGELKLIPLTISIVGVLATGLFVSFSYHRWKFDPHPALVTGLLAGRIFGAAAAWAMNALFVKEGTIPIIRYATESIEGDLKGIAVQLAFLPLIAMVFEKVFRSNKRR